MTVKEIVAKYLKENGYDGLWNGLGCGCVVDDLMPCCANGLYDCEPGYRVPCDPETCQADGECEWHIGKVEADAS